MRRELIYFGVVTITLSSLMLLFTLFPPQEEEKNCTTKCEGDLLIECRNGVYYIRNCSKLMYKRCPDCEFEYYNGTCKEVGGHFDCYKEGLW